MIINMLKLYEYEDSVKSGKYIYIYNSKDGGHIFRQRFMLNYPVLIGQSRRRTL